MVNRDAEARLTREDICELFRFVPETGFFFWLDRGPARKVNHPAGGLNTKGYRVLLIKKRQYLAHRVAWFLHYGEWPDLIDHINGNKNDNRIENLRSVTQALNTQNRVVSKRNKSGHTGVYYNKKRNRYLVTVSQIQIGWFRTLEEAIEARRKGEDLYFTHSKRQSLP